MPRVPSLVVTVNYKNIPYLTQLILLVKMIFMFYHTFAKQYNHSCKKFVIVI